MSAGKSVLCHIDYLLCQMDNMSKTRQTLVIIAKWHEIIIEFYYIFAPEKL